jgi:hypothetical protein
MNILCLGQSNFGNHLERRTKTGAGSLFNWRVDVGDEIRKEPIQDPIPTCSGSQGSIWPAFAEALQTADLQLTVFALGGTAVSYWAEGYPVKTLSEDLLPKLSRSGLVPDLVIWGQGDVDNYLKTETASYLRSHALLRMKILEHFPGTKFIVNLCSYRYGITSDAVRSAQHHIAESSLDCYLGIDMDALGGEYRMDGAHYNFKGQLEAGKRLAARVSEIVQLK